PGRAQHHSPDVAVRGNPGADQGQLRGHGRAQRVHRGGPVQHDLRDDGLAAPRRARVPPYGYLVCGGCAHERRLPAGQPCSLASLDCSSSTSWNRVDWTRCTCGISFSTSCPCSPADSTTSFPQPSTRTIRPCWKDTSLIRISGKSRPDRDTTPLRSRSRRVVSS